jgi:16S rRNA (guanine527-N7)-methyltransferase
MDALDRTRLLHTLRTGATGLDLTLSDAQAEQFVRYAALLLDANARTNLTRITAPGDVARLHFVDSLTVLAACRELPEGAPVIDVGTGAGFPGVPLKIFRPDLRLTLADSLGKRLTFLADVVAALGLGDVTLVHARAEDLGRDPVHRHAHDLVVARAVAALPTLLEWCTPLAKPNGGRFLAMKSAAVDDELAASEAAQRALRVRLERDVALDLPPRDEAEPVRRRLLVFAKTGPTPPRFPRRPADIKKAPLA